MSFWEKLFSAEQQHNEHKNQIACVENDCSCKTNEQLLEALVKARDEDVSLPYDRSPFPAGPVSFSFFTSFRLADSGHSNNFLSRHL